MGEPTFTPFSNGTEHHLWTGGNCGDGCVKAVDVGDASKPFRCAIQSALSLGTITGSIPERIARRAGFIDGDGKRLHGAGYFPCPEFNDSRQATTRRGPRPATGQQALHVGPDEYPGDGHCGSCGVADDEPCGDPEAGDCG